VTSFRDSLAQSSSLHFKVIEMKRNQENLKEKNDWKENNGHKSWHLFRREFRINLQHIQGKLRLWLNENYEGVMEVIREIKYFEDARGLNGLLQETFIPLKSTGITEVTTKEFLETEEKYYTARIGDFVHVFYLNRLDSEIKNVLLRKCLEEKTEKGWRKYNGKEEMA
jgi:hypothetical protein